MSLKELFEEAITLETGIDEEAITLETGIEEEAITLETGIEEEVVEEITVDVEPSPEEPGSVEVEIQDEEVEPEEVEDFEVPTIDEDEEAEVEVKAPEPEILAEEHSYFDEGPELVVEENAEAIQMAKDIIFEALEADDIIVAEIDQVSAEEIDIALEAIGSDEAIPIDDETDATDQLDEESLLELETILGPLDRSVGGLGTIENEDDDDEHLPLNGETLAELDRLFDARESEETDE